MLRTSQCWRLHLKSFVFSAQNEKRMTSSFRPTPRLFYWSFPKLMILHFLRTFPQTLLLLAYGNSADKCRQWQSKTRHLAKLWLEPELMWEAASILLFLPSYSISGDIQQALCNPPPALAVAVRFWNCLQLLYFSALFQITHFPLNTVFA